MSRRSALLLTAALVTLGAVSLGYRYLASEKPGGERVFETGIGSAEIQDESVASIYFPATSGMLEPEIRTVPANLDRAGRQLWLAEQLTVGPEAEGLRPALPPSTEVAGVFAASDGTVFVDFTVSNNAVGMGSAEELLVIYSVVNTLLLDDESSDRAVILFNGRQRETLAGHVDTSLPLAARPDLIRGAG